MLGFLKVQRHMDRGVTALLPVRIAELVHEQAVNACAKKSTQLAFRGIVRGEKIFLQQAGEEVLGEILSVFTLHVPAQPHVLVHRTPVRTGDGVHGADAFLRIAALRGRHHGVAGEGECVALWIVRQGNSF